MSETTASYENNPPLSHLVQSMEQLNALPRKEIDTAHRFHILINHGSRHLIESLPRDEVKDSSVLGIVPLTGTEFSRTGDDNEQLFLDLNLSSYGDADLIADSLISNDVAHQDLGDLNHFTGEMLTRMVYARTHSRTRMIEAAIVDKANAGDSLAATFLARIDEERAVRYTYNNTDGIIYRIASLKCGEGEGPTKNHIPYCSRIADNVCEFLGERGFTHREQARIKSRLLNPRSVYPSSRVFSDDLNQLLSLYLSERSKDDLDFYISAS